MKTISVTLFFILFLSFNSYADSFTECVVHIQKLYVGDDGNLYVFYVGGGSVVIPPSSADQKNALSVALAAFLAGREIVVRYKTAGASCTTELVDDFRGLWILNN